MKSVETSEYFAYGLIFKDVDDDRWYVKLSGLARATAEELCEAFRAKERENQSS